MSSWPRSNTWTRKLRKALCANVTETASQVEFTVEGEQRSSHDAEHGQEERREPSARGDSVRDPGGGAIGRRGEPQHTRSSQAAGVHGRVQAVTGGTLIPLFSQ